MNERALSALFRKLGARNPKGWANSQVKEGIPQLARFLFLREAWKLVVNDDRNWISEMHLTRPSEPGGEIVQALDRVRSQGSSEHDLTTIVRIMQWRLLAGFCKLLDGPEDLEPDVRDLDWRLFQVDEDGAPISSIGGLAESVLETDPTGHEMRAPSC